MLNKMRYFIRKRGLKLRDLAPLPLLDTIGESADGSITGPSLISWVLIALVSAGVIFAIVKIVQISKKKKEAQA